MVEFADKRIGCGYLAVPEVEAVLWLAWTPVGLANALWEVPRQASGHASRPPEIAEAVPELAIPDAYALPLRAYFAGEPIEPAELPVDLSGSDFQARVWQALRRVGRGAVRSYAGIAIDVGSPRATRAVGMANASNPVAVVVPCHRVVEKDMSLGGYSAGARIKRYLLALEGVHVVGDHVQPGQLRLI